MIIFVLILAVSTVGVHSQQRATPIILTAKPGPVSPIVITREQCYSPPITPYDGAVKISKTIMPNTIPPMPIPFTPEIITPIYPMPLPFTPEIVTPIYPMPLPFTPEIVTPIYPMPVPFTPEVVTPIYPMQVPFTPEIVTPTPPVPVPFMPEGVTPISTVPVIPFITELVNCPDLCFEDILISPLGCLDPILHTYGTNAVVPLPKTSVSPLLASSPPESASSPCMSRLLPLVTDCDSYSLKRDPIPPPFI